MPPAACHPARIAAPEAVPGSTNANNLNNANGAATDTQISTTPGSAVPTVASIEPALPVATPSVNLTPTPITITTSSGVAAAACVHRTDFQNQAQVVWLA